MNELLILLSTIIGVTLLASWYFSVKTKKYHDSTKIMISDISRDTNKNLVIVHKDLSSKLDYIAQQFTIKVEGNDD